MSLYNPPHLDASVFAPCTCGTTELRHRDYCAVVDEAHPAREKAREQAQRQARYWFWPKGSP